MALKRRRVLHPAIGPAADTNSRSLHGVLPGLVRTSRRATTLALSTLLATGAIAFTVQPSYAYSCIPGRTAAGGTYSADVAPNTGGGTINGVSALIEEYNPYTTDSTGTNVSLMLTQGSISGWAQFGWMKTKIQAPDGHIGSMHRSVGIEFHPQTGSPNWEFWTAKPVGHMTWYEINHDSTAHVFYFFLEGTLIWDQNSFMSTNVYELITETHNRQDQFPGNRFNPVVVDNMNYFTPPGYTPHISTAPILPNSNAAPFVGLSPPNGHAANGKYQVWDTDCT